MAGIKTDSSYEDAKIERNTRLYRIVKTAYSDQSNLLNGKGGYYSESRYNYMHQPTSYCSNNVLLCISELLFHMYDVSLRKLKNKNLSEFRTESSKIFELVVFQCEEIDNLIFIDSDQGKHNYQLNPSAITHSDTIYAELQDASHRIRINSRDGIVTPSARHSQGFVVVLFGDHTSTIRNIEYKFHIELSLLKEDLSISVKDPLFSPIQDRISQNVGCFEFDSNEFRTNNSYLEPLPSSYTGKIDFSRSYYSGSYPNSAIK